MLALRSKAIAAVCKAVAKGDLPRPKLFQCSDCSRPARVYDHRDYTKPLQVDPVCYSCNTLRGTAKPLYLIEREAA